MNGIERLTRFALSAVLGMAAMLTKEITDAMWFDINVYDRVDRVQNYAQFVSLTWIFVGLSVVAFIWSFEGILARFARQEQKTEEWLEEQVEADQDKFNDTW
jgi:hypothetical protein